MNRGAGSNGGGGGGGTPTNQTPPSAYGHYQPYMSPYSSGLSPGGPYQTTGSGGNSGPGPDQFGTNFNVQSGGGYYSQPSPNEDGQGGNGSGGPAFYGGGTGPPHAPPGSVGSPGSRDLSYYGFNNGFGNSGDGGGSGGGGGNGGSAFYQQQQHTQQDNNNKVSNIPGDTTSVHEFGDTIKKEEQLTEVDSKQQQDSTNEGGPPGSTPAPGGPGVVGAKAEPGPGSGPGVGAGGSLQPLNSNDPQNRFVFMRICLFLIKENIDSS